MELGGDISRSVEAPVSAPRPRARKWRASEMRSLLIQVVIAVGLVYIGWSALSNVATNLERQMIAQGFAFLDKTASFAISQALIPWNETMTHGRAFLVGLLNTLLVAVVGIFFTTILGFFVGVARLSRNPVLSRLAYWYVEIVRNIPLLFQMLFWYLAVLSALPAPRNSYSLIDSIFLNQRGLVFPRPVLGDGFWLIPAAFVLALAVALIHASRRRRMRRMSNVPEQMASRPWHTAALAGCVIVAPLAVWLWLDAPLALEIPQQGKFNLTGGITVVPEMVAILLSLVIYTAAFVAEIVRSGIQSVDKGQWEAGHALGLREWRILMLIVMPQALRVIIPPLTSQYLNLTKNSSLGAAIGFPDVVAVGGTIISQTGQAIEVILMWMACYLTISLVTSIFMNWYNRRVALVER